MSEQPEGRGAGIEERGVDESAARSTIVVRMSRGLHAELKELAWKGHESLNSFCLRALRKAARPLLAELEDRREA